MKLPLLALLLAYGVFFGCLHATTSALPERMASHFDATGAVNGWMSRSSYMNFMTGVAVSLPLIMVASTFLIGWTGGRFMNLPHRDYWLAPEQLAATIASVQRFIIGFCSLFVLFFTGLHLLVVAANAESATPRLNSDAVWSLAAIFLLATVVWAWMLFRRFAQPGRQRAPELLETRPTPFAPSLRAPRPAPRGARRAA